MISRDSLFYELSFNRELEFSVAGMKLFLTPHSNGVFDLWDAAHKKLLLRGSLNEIFSYKVLGKYSLDEDASRFVLEYLL